MGRKKKYLTEEERITSNKLRAKIWQDNNKEKFKNYQDNYRESNQKKELKRHEKYREENVDKINKGQKIYRLNNPEKIKERKLKYNNNNKHTIACRSVLRNALKRFGQIKETKTINLLGYSALEFKQHIELLFTDGMSWDNYGEWHIDHIIGIINFDKNTHPSIVNALSNLRPIWATTREINGVIYEGNLNRAKYLN